MPGGRFPVAASFKRISAPPVRYLSLGLTLGFVVLFALLKAGAAATTGTAALLCLWALAGGRQALQALAVMVVIKYLNPDVYSYSQEFGLLAWLLLIVAGLRIFATAGLRNLRAAVPAVVFSLVAGALSFLQENRNWDISAMKIFIFGYGSATLLAGFSSLKDDEAGKMAVWLVNLTAAVVLLSIAVLPFKGIAYGKYGGFRGILSHPQTLGPMLAPITAWIIAGALFRKGSKLFLPGIAILVLMALMVLSQARTSVITVLLSLGAAFLVAALGRKTFVGFRAVRTLALSSLALVLLAGGLAGSSGLRAALTGFVFKYHTKTLDGALASRSGGIASQWDSFLEHPLVGNGFGVYPWGEFPSGVVRVMGIPISAPVEKGFLPTAILEEVGVAGTLAFLYLLVSTARRVVRAGDPRWVAMFFACLFVNVGEMVFFSTGGIGLYFWLLLALSTRMGMSGIREGATAPVLSRQLYAAGTPPNTPRPARTLPRHTAPSELRTSP
jgi:hypothetical protein